MNIRTKTNRSQFINLKYLVNYLSMYVDTCEIQKKITIEVQYQRIILRIVIVIKMMIIPTTNVIKIQCFFNINDS